MATNNALIEKRKDLKRRLAEGEYKTLVDVFLEGTNRLIQKVIRRPKPLPTWIVVLVLIVTVFMLGYISIGLTGELNDVPPVASFGYFGTILSFILVGTLAMVSAVAINQYISRIFALWQDEVVEATESLESLNRFESWLENVCNLRIHLLVTILGGLAGSSTLIALLSAQAGGFAGFGFSFTLFILGMFSAGFFYLFLLVLFLSARLRQFHLKLFSTDPSSSELISRLSSEFSFIVYFAAIYAAILTLVTTLSGGVIPLFNFFLVLFLWLPIIVMFVLNQTSLASIIRRAKWKTLNEAQAKVENLRTSKNFGDQETMDAIKCLMDYHDRVKATRDSALDFRTYLNFINSLLLPLLAFVLGNLDLVFSLFTSEP